MREIRPSKARRFRSLVAPGNVLHFILKFTAIWAAYNACFFSFLIFFNASAAAC